MLSKQWFRPEDIGTSLHSRKDLALTEKSKYRSVGEAPPHCSLISAVKTVLQVPAQRAVGSSPRKTAPLPARHHCSHRQKVLLLSVIMMAIHSQALSSLMAGHSQSSRLPRSLGTGLTEQVLKTSETKRWHLGAGSAA